MFFCLLSSVFKPFYQQSPGLKGTPGVFGMPELIYTICQHDLLYCRNYTILVKLYYVAETALLPLASPSAVVISRQKAISTVQACWLLGQPSELHVAGQFKALAPTWKDAQKNHSELDIKVVWLIWVEPPIGQSHRKL